MQNGYIRNSFSFTNACSLAASIEYHGENMLENRHFFALQSMKNCTISHMSINYYGANPPQSVTQKEIPPQIVTQDETELEEDHGTGIGCSQDAQVQFNVNKYLSQMD